MYWRCHISRAHLFLGILGACLAIGGPGYADEVGHSCVYNCGGSPPTTNRPPTGTHVAPSQPPGPSPAEIQQRQEEADRREAIRLNEEGIAAFNRHDFDLAVQKYNDALAKMRNPHDRETIQKNRQRAIDAKSREADDRARVRAQEIIRHAADDIVAQPTTDGSGFSHGSPSRPASPSGFSNTHTAANSSPGSGFGGRGQNRAYGQAVTADHYGHQGFSMPGPNAKPNQVFDGTQATAVPTNGGVFVGSGWRPLPPERETPELRNQHRVVDRAQVQMAALDRQLRAAQSAPQRDTVAISKLHAQWAAAQTATLAAQKDYNQMVDKSFHPDAPPP